MLSYGQFSCSIDKIKLRGKFQDYRHKWIPNLCKVRTWCEFALPHNIELISDAESLLPFKYRFAFTLRVKGEKEGTFYVCEHYNGDFKNSKAIPNAFMIEYNPNKSGRLIYKSFCETFIFSFTDLVSFDIAYDVPNANVNDVFIDTMADVMTYGKVNNRTLYIAPKEDKSGRVKVYNKHIERERFDVELCDTLRIEASVKSKGLDFSKLYLTGETLEELTRTVNHLNSVKIKQNSADDNDWKTYALSCLTPEQLTKCLLLMGVNTRTKYRTAVEKCSYYTLDLDVMTLACHISKLLEPWKERFKI